MSNIKKNVQLKLKEVIQETSDIYSFVWEVPRDFDWAPGQHGVWKFVDRDIKTGKDFRIFSFATIREEGRLMFSTRIVEEPSEFKQQLLALEKGDAMTVDGPMGQFMLDDLQRPTLIMAGGIGVTPVRAFMKQIENLDKDPGHMRVFYSDDRGEFAYEGTLKHIHNRYGGLTIDFIDDRNVFTDKIDDFAKEYLNDALYYISGTPGMTDFISGKLKELGVIDKNIMTDSFMGYE